MKKKIRWKTKSGFLTMKIKHGSKPGISFDRNDFRINPLTIIKNLFGNWKLIAGIAAVVMIITSGLIYFVPNQYASNASLLPSGSKDNFSALKELAGIGSMSSGADENSSVLFPEILRSRQVKDALLEKTYIFSDNGENYSLKLSEYFDTKTPSYLYQNLDKITSIDQNKKTGVISMVVETEYPELSQALLQTYLDELEHFNSHKRASTAKENVRYLEREVTKIANDLRLTEDKLETFQMANRSWDLTTDPEILKNLARFERDLTVKTETFAFVQGQYELAKLEAQKDIPIIRVLDSPSLPTVKSSPRRMMTVAGTGAATTFLVAIFLIIANAIKLNNAVATNLELPQTIVKRTKVPTVEKAKGI